MMCKLHLLYKSCDIFSTWVIATLIFSLHYTVPCLWSLCCLFPQHPFIELRVMENNKRSRRNLGLDCDEHSTESRCCRYPLTVDFEAFGWDWIIAPKRYKANYCSGQCEYMFMQKYPHTHLVQQANPRGSAGPCCTPTKMSPINMLYFNDKQKIIYGKIPGMVVDRCGCS